MEFLNTYYLDILKNKYAKFNGRARRKEFWMFYLILSVISFVLSIIGSVLGSITSVLGTIMQIVSLLFFLANLVPLLSIGVRRLHDVDLNGLLIIIPVVNLILCILPGKIGVNKYGPDPKESDIDQLGNWSN